jgi:hypothetical protein
LGNRMTRCIGVKVAQNVAQPFKKNTVICNQYKSRPKFLGYFCNFLITAQSKPSLIGRKYAQSGHPVG